jgi:hypothetical protein
MELNAVDVSTLNYRYASTLMAAPIANFADEYYLGTLVLHVPMDAKGTFTIPFLLPPDTALVDSNNQFIPLIGMQSGTVTVTTGRCCFGLGVDDKKAGCIEDVTANQCVNVGLCKGYCDLDPGILCLSDHDCLKQTGTEQICVAGATLGGICAPGPKPGGKDIECEDPEVCVVQGKAAFTPGASCADGCVECLTNDQCDDGVDCTNDSCVDGLCVYTPNNGKCEDNNPCTDNVCDPVTDCQYPNDDTNDCADELYCNGAEECQSGVCLVKGKLPCDDNLDCTTDTCDEDTDSCTNAKKDASDSDPCTIDLCNEPGPVKKNILLPPLPDPSCPIVASSLAECLLLTVDQYTGLPVATAWDEASGCCLCVLCSNHTACDDYTAIIPACRADISFNIHGSAFPNPMCFGQGEKIVVDVMAGESLQPIYGAQFIVDYDPACVTFNSISPAGDPFVFEVEEIHDAANGRVFYAVGVTSQTRSRCTPSSSTMKVSSSVLIRSRATGSTSRIRSR